MAEVVRVTHRTITIDKISSRLATIKVELKYPLERDNVTMFLGTFDRFALRTLVDALSRTATGLLAEGCRSECCIPWCDGKQCACHRND